MSDPAPISDPASQSAALLAMLWQRGLPRLQERLAELDATVAAARAGTLDPRDRDEAAATAHKLAGSLGMFGYHAGTDAARVLEKELEIGAAGDIAKLEQSLSDLHAALPL